MRYLETKRTKLGHLLGVESIIEGDGQY
jgi:hypothetical protein